MRNSVKKSTGLKGGILLLIGFAFWLPCAIDRQAGAEEKPAKVAPTFTADIAPIFQHHCQECHRAGGIAPMSLVTYEEVRPWARSIKEQVLSREMPPFHAAGEIGYFQDDLRLTAEKIAMIGAWADAGAPKGEAKQDALTRSWPASWKYGVPDLVLGPSKPLSLSPNPQDLYRLFVPDYVFPEDTWIRGLEIRPGNLRVVHHVSLYIVPERYKPGPDGIVENADLFVRGGQLVGSWVPGASPRYYEEGYGTLISKGTRFALQIHYAPMEKAESDQTMIGFYFANGEVRKQNYMLYGGTDNIDIPPGEPAYQIVQRRKFKTDALVKAFTAHMHLRGKSFTIRLYYPDGKEETVFDVPRFNFNWQRFYKLSKPIPVPAGTIAEFIAVWDNSAKNRYNPDPTARVKFGERTRDEMMSGNIQYEIPQEDLRIAVAHGRVVK